MDRGLGGARKQALRNFPKFQHCSPVQSLQSPSWLFMTMTFYTKTTLHTATTLPQWLLSVLKSEIWQWWFPLYMMMNESSLVRWRWKSVLFTALWRHKLQWCHNCNWLIRVCKGCTFHWCIDCGKYCCLICQSRKLFGRPSFIHTRGIPLYTVTPGVN